MIGIDALSPRLRRSEVQLRGTLWRVPLAILHIVEHRLGSKAEIGSRDSDHLLSFGPRQAQGQSRSTTLMPVGNGSFVSSLIPRWFRRKKSPSSSSKSTGNVFEERMKQRLKKKKKKKKKKEQSRRSSRISARSVANEFATFDLLAARDRSVVAKNANRVRKQQWPHVLSWDSAADTFVSPPSSAGAGGGVMGTTHTNTPPDYDPETSLLTREEISKDAAFRLQQLAQLDVRNATPSFVYQVPRESARKWSSATTKGSEDQ